MLRTLFSNRVSRLVLVLVLLLACVLTVSACGGTSTGEESKGAVGASPAASSSGGGSSSPSVSASEEALVPPPPVSERYPHDKPEYPQEGYVHSQEGAIKVAQYFTELIGYSYSTLDTRPLEKLCDKKTAQNCLELIESVEESHKDHSWYVNVDTTDYSVKGAYLPKENTPGEIAFRFIVKGSTYKFYNGKPGAVEEDVSDPDQEVVVNLTWKNNNWIVTDGTFMFLEEK